MKSMILVLFAIFTASPADAFTECYGKVTSLWSGDGGMIWVFLDSGGSAVITANDPNREAVISLGTTALVAQRSVKIRYSADNVSCTSQGRQDFVGMYIY